MICELNSAAEAQRRRCSDGPRSGYSCFASFYWTASSIDVSEVLKASLGALCASVAKLSGAMWKWLDILEAPGMSAISSHAPPFQQIRCNFAFPFDVKLATWFE
jgi:hypothetical protein